MGAAVRAAPRGRAGRGRGMAAGGADMGGSAAQEVLRQVRVGPESRVEGPRVEGTLGTVGAERTRGERTAGLPPAEGGGGGAGGVAQDGKDCVFPLGWGGGRGGGRGGGAVLTGLLGAGLLLLDLQQGLF